MADEQEQEGKKKKGPLMLILIVLVLVGASVGGTLYFMGFFSGEKKEGDGHEEAAAEEHGGEESHGPKVIVYHKFEQPFTVNFQTATGLRFLQVEMEAMAYDQHAIDELVKHMPVVRNKVIFLLSSQRYEDLISREGKERLRQQVLEAIQSVLKERSGSAGIEEVFFTSFVIQ